MDDLMREEIPDDAIEMLRLQLDAELMRQHQEAMQAELEVRKGRTDPGGAAMRRSSLYFCVHLQ